MWQLLRDLETQKSRLVAVSGDQAANEILQLAGGKLRTEPDAEIQAEIKTRRRM